MPPRKTGVGLFGFQSQAMTRPGTNKQCRLLALSTANFGYGGWVSFVARSWLSSGVNQLTERPGRCVSTSSTQEKETASRLLCV